MRTHSVAKKKVKMASDLTTYWHVVALISVGVSVRSGSEFLWDVHL